MQARPENRRAIEYKISILNSVFSGGRDLTASSFIVYENTTSGHTDLCKETYMYCTYSTYMFLYNIYIYIYIIM